MRKKFAVWAVCFLPTLLFALEALGANVTLSWCPSSGPVAGYNVYVAQGVPDSYTGTPIDVGNVTRATITNLIPNIRYSFIVKAYDASGNSSGASNTVVTMVLGTPTPSGVWMVAQPQKSGCNSQYDQFGSAKPWLAYFGVGLDNLLVGYVDSGSIVDAVGFVNSGGVWYVAKGSGVGNSTEWARYLGQGSSSQLLGDVKGTGRDAAFVFFDAGGQWYGALPGAGDYFQQASLWTSYFGQGSTKRMMKDVNRDGRADALLYYNTRGQWYATLSSASGNYFEAPRLWADYFGEGSADQMVTEDGSGTAHAKVFFDSGGVWYDSISVGTHFGTVVMWAQYYGQGTRWRLSGDVDGDGFDDMVIGFPNGDWWVSRGNATGAYSQPTKWLTGFGGNARKCFLGKVEQSNRESLICAMP